MQGFQGHGYSQEFTDNMTVIVDKLRAEPDTIVKIVDSCDDICAPCPRKKNEICNRKTDRRVIKKIKIKPGIQMKIGDGFELVNSTFASKKDLKRICGRCEWHAKCRWYQSRTGDKIVGG
jgi:hypothetical protein